MLRITFSGLVFVWLDLMIRFISFDLIGLGYYRCARNLICISWLILQGATIVDMTVAIILAADYEPPAVAPIPTMVECQTIKIYNASFHL